MDDAGLHLTVDGKPRLLEVDTGVVCAGQVKNDALATPLQAAGRTAYVIGGALEAGELDAKRAIALGAKAAAEI